MTTTRTFLRSILLCAAMTCALAPGCGGEEESPVCDQGIEKLKTCPKAKVQQQGDVDCTGRIECQMKCIVDATCAELETNDPNSTYGECEAACK